MSRSFNTQNYPVVAPQPKLLVQPMQLYTPLNEQPLFAPVFIDWTVYNNAGTIQNVGVKVDLAQVTGGSARMSRVASVFIDNSSSNVPVYVNFPDTNFTVPCGPGESITQTVITGQTAAVIYGVGFTGGAQPQTTVYFSNQVLQPSQGADFATFIPQYFASVYANNPVSNQTPFRSLALGDRVFSQQFAVTTVLSGASLAPLTGAGGFYAFFDTNHPFSHTFNFSPNNAGAYVYITDFSLTISGFSIFSSTSATNYQHSFVGGVSLTDDSGALNYGARYISVFSGISTTAGQATTNNASILARSNIQIKLPTNQNFYVKTDAMLFPSGTYNNTSTPGITFTHQSNFNMTLNVTYTTRDESSL